MDPLGKRKRRRSTSKLTSLDSLQASLDNDDEGAEDDSDEESEEESQLSIGRKKRSKSEHSSQRHMTAEKQSVLLRLY